MKEYLLERNGKYELHKGGIVPDGAIEVPEGAFAMTFKCSFYKLSGGNILFGATDDWVKSCYKNIEDIKGLAWQRPTQPEELPFVDDGPLSLNEKYEKMENLKIKVNSEAESKEVQELFLGLGYVKDNWLWSGYSDYPIELRTRDGGYSDFKLNAGNAIERKEITLPELRQLAGIVSLNDQYAEIEKVRQTLKERATQYGSFEDVAMTTQKIMDAIAWARGSDKLPAPHQEALHMIASKIARIVNGNHNHKDSWHDIQGYAKLIEDHIG